MNRVDIIDPAVAEMKKRKGEGMKEKIVEKESFGEKWPFTVDKGVLINRKGAVTFKHDTKEYGLNGDALTRGYAHIEPIWKASDEVPDCMQGKSSIKMSLKEIIILGLNL